jgi:hypothetical protein
MGAGGGHLYESSWYDGPWAVVSPADVPAFVLRVPAALGQPRGHEWATRRAGWDRWDHAKAPPRAPLPASQKGYGGNRYPSGEMQATLHDHDYPYWPRETEGRKAHQAHGMSGPRAAHASAQGHGDHHGKNGKENER